MNMVTISEHDEWTGPRVVGRFDLDAAAKYDEDADWDGSNNVSAATGTSWDHQQLLRTASKGHWVLHSYSDKSGSLPSFTYISDERARDWLLINGHDDAVRTWFDINPNEEIGPGRPAIGRPFKLSLPDELRDAIEAETPADSSIAATIRTLLSEALDARRAGGDRD